MDSTNLGELTDEETVLTIQDVPPAWVTKHVVVKDATVSTEGISPATFIEVSPSHLSLYCRQM